MFFRAKEWDDAIKVLDSMFSLYNIVLPNILERRFPFLNDLGVEFGGFVENIKGELLTPVWIISILIILLFSKNSMEMSKKFNVNVKYFTLQIFMLFTSLYFLDSASEFLYYNF